MYVRRRTTDNIFGLRHWHPWLTSDNGVVAGGGSASPTVPGAVGSADSGAPGADTVGGGQSIDWGQFNQGLNLLGDRLASGLEALRGDVNNLPEHLRPPAQEPPAPDYDTMTQADLATHITGSVLKSIESMLAEKLGPLVAQVQNVQQTVATNSVTAEVKQMRAEHKDFGDWKDEMVALAREHPTLGITRLYNLARAENTEKAKALDTRYNPPAPPPPPRFGGFAPSAPGATGATPPLSRTDAGRAAYQEVQGRHPGVLAALESL